MRKWLQFTSSGFTMDIKDFIQLPRSMRTQMLKDAEDLYTQKLEMMVQLSIAGGLSKMI